MIADTETRRSPVRQPVQTFVGSDGTGQDSRSTPPGRQGGDPARRCSALLGDARRMYSGGPGPVRSDPDPAWAPASALRLQAASPAPSRYITPHPPATPRTVPSHLASPRPASPRAATARRPCRRCPGAGGRWWLRQRRAARRSGLGRGQQQVGCTPPPPPSPPHPAGLGHTFAAAPPAQPTAGPAGAEQS